jgi:hypothetical protein
MRDKILQVVIIDILEVIAGRAHGQTLAVLAHDLLGVRLADHPNGRARPCPASARPRSARRELWTTRMICGVSLVEHTSGSGA